MERWTTEMELLAQIIEEVSVVSSHHQRKKPREIPRPGWMKRQGPVPKRQPQAQVTPDGHSLPPASTPEGRAINMLRATAPPQRKAIGGRK